jgi:hypothetical protein
MLVPGIMNLFGILSSLLRATPYSNSSQQWQPAYHQNRLKRAAGEKGGVRI